MGIFSIGDFGEELLNEPGHSLRTVATHGRKSGHWGAPYAQKKLIERFDAEFNGRYELSPWIDPAYDEKNGSKMYEEDSFEEKLRRLEVREYMILRLKKAKRNNNQEEIEFCNSFRELPPLPGSDDGWNVIPASDEFNKEYQGMF